MNSETSTHPFPTSADTGPDGGAGEIRALHSFARKVHEAVDTLEQRIESGSDRVLNMQQEYGDMAREQVRANPLAALAASFVAGFILAKLL
ncbi:MAG TPA: hypothetical protein VHA82_20685 [Ramlibacter sp.]|uniref:hypothetical protein n=1 Tax=Ramlibacter sp. TaxID=1917967 RepID=UPI002B694F1C|nr:hypothetical protein [Ramlibacter sp.]HVZ46233.1 hypothetical protein [Ramlibacter sp.]